ncbi:MAG: hypothetical protein BRD35_08550 [Bacteroidetes bacterium QH_7_62_13]|nr:MAG: hypothetical protein BRD35_08550 [Bacteroidetes bacterium QH_7_62_13]
MMGDREGIWEYKSIIILAILCLSFSASFYYVFDQKVDLNGDNAKYYLLAESIAEGKGYVSVYSPGEPPTSIYPPGYPVLMSPVMMFTESVSAQKVLNGIFLLLSGILLFFVSREVTGNDVLSGVVSLSTLLNVHLLKFASMMMSEASFILFSLLSVFLLAKSSRDQPWRDGYFYLFLLTLSFAFHIRTQGIALVGGVLFYYLCTRQWSHLSLTSVGFVLLALPWRIRNRVQDLGSSRYLDELMKVNPWRPEKGEVSIAGLFDRFLEQGGMLVAKGIPDSAFNFITADYQKDILLQEWGIGLLVLSAMMYGFWRLKKYNLFFFGYFLAVFVIVATWSAPVDNRYLITFIPFMHLGIFYGVYVAGREMLERANVRASGRRVVQGGLLVVALLMIPGLNDLHAKANRAYPRAYYNYFQVANELGQKQGCRNTLVSCRKPALFYLFSNCHTTRYTSSTDATKVISDMVEKGVDYVVLAQLGYSSTSRYLYPAIQKNKDLFAPVMQKKEPNTYVLKFNRDLARERVSGR